MRIRPMIVPVIVLWAGVAACIAQELPYYPDVAIVIRDYAGNIQTTDRTWYYTWSAPQIGRR